MFPPVDTKLDFGGRRSEWIGHLQSGEAGVVDRDRDIEAVVPVSLDHGGDRGGEMRFGGRGGEQVDVFGRAVEEAVCLHGVAAREAEPVLADSRQRYSGQALVERIHDGSCRLIRQRRSGRGSGIPRVDEPWRVGRGVTTAGGAGRC